MNTRFMQTIWQITEVMQQETQLEAALSESLDLITKAVGCEEGSVWMRNEKDGRVYAMLNVGKTDITGYSVDMGQGIAGTVTRDGVSEIVADTKQDPRFSSVVDEETGFVTRSLVCAPLKNQYDCLGCVQLVNKIEGNFDKEDLEVLENLAALLAIAIEEKGFSVTPNKDRKPFITLRGVIKEYGSGELVNQVLKGIDLDVYENELLVVLGESGCGKSTMLNIIGGMDTMTRGELVIDGKDMSHPTDAELTDYRRNFVGFIFQSYNLMPNLTAKENIDFIAELMQDPMDSREALKMVRLSGREGNYPSQMSGGQQQRVSIARAFAKRPRLILADEPTAALDFQTGQEVLMVMEEAIRETGTTIVMITHNVEIAKMANRVIKLKNGRVHSIRANMHPLSASELVW